MKPDFTELYDREKKIFHLVNKIEARGLRFDWKKAVRKNTLIKSKMKECLEDLGGLNPNSPAQVLNHLLLLGVKEKELTNKGKVTTEEKVLERVLATTQKKRVKEFIIALLDYRSLKKISGTYLEPLARRAKENDGIIYCSINPSDSRTGRMSSSGPNLQNIPEPKSRTTGKTNPVRECFIPREGFANYYFDYSAIEMALFGLIAHDDRIVNGYLSGEDIHAYMAKLVWGDKYYEDPKYWRGVTKNLSYGVIYGMGVKKMALTYGFSLKDAKEYNRIYMNEFQTIGQFQEECEWKLRNYGYIEDDYGRRYSIPVGQAYKGVNAIIQGSCAQIFKIALLNVGEFVESIPDEYQFETNIILPVHDETQEESKMWKEPEFEMEICLQTIEHMQNIPQLNEIGFKLRVDVAKSVTNWAEKQHLEV